MLPNDDPNGDFNTSDNNVEWISKVSGSYNFPYGVLASALYESRSGDVWARNVLFSGGATIPTLAVNVEPIGTQQYPTVNHLDVRLEKQFRLLRDARVRRQNERVQRPECQHRVVRDDAVWRVVPGSPHRFFQLVWPRSARPISSELEQEYHRFDNP